MAKESKTATVEDGARYRVLSDSFIDNHLRKAGEEIEFDGYPGHNLQPLNDAAEAKAVAGAKVAAEAMEKLIANTRPIGAQDLASVASVIAEAIKAGLAAGKS